MATHIQNINKVKSGLCPHGLPPGACPICSNMGGGSSLRVGERPQKAGEMSYHECAMIGNMMRARELAQKQHAHNLEKHSENIKNFENSLANAANRMIVLAQNFSKIMVLKPVAFVLQNIIVPVLNVIKNIPNFVTNTINSFKQITQKVFDIMDKLNAIFGELKAFIDKKVSEFVSVIKTKFKNLFKIFKKHDAEDDDTKIDDDKKIFNLKNMLHRISAKLKRKKDKDE